MNDAIRTALTALDPSKPEDWTKGGLPSLEAVRELVSPDVTREQIDAAAPGFTRKHPHLEAANVSEPAPAVATDAPPILPGPPALAAAPAIEEAPATTLDAPAVAAAQVEESKGDLYRVEKAIANAESALAKISPRPTPAEEYQRYVANANAQRAARAEAARLAPPAGPVRSKLDQRIAARNRMERRAAQNGSRR